MNHDIDRTLTELEMEGEWETDDSEGLEGGELEWEDRDVDADEFEEELEYEAPNAATSPLTEDEEMEMAAELLNVTSEADLDQFLGRIASRAARGIRNVASRGRAFLKSSAGKRLLRVARGVAKKALPVLGRAAGAAIGGPAGAAIGGRVASAAGRAFGLELEGLSPEDQEFETARRVVRLTAAATNAAVGNAARGVPPSQAVRRGVVAAARRHAPGLLRGQTGQGRASGGMSGRWVRRGSRIILDGV
jgi:hypothetical protein